MSGFSNCHGTLFSYDFQKPSYVYNLQVHREGEGDKKLYQFLAPFPHARLELALPVSPPSHLVCCRKGTSAGAIAQAAASEKLGGFPGGKV